MSNAPVVLLRRLLRAHEAALRGLEGQLIESSLEQVEGELQGDRAAPLQATELGNEFEALGQLYRAIRAADATMQRQLRSSDVSDRLTRLYYGLRTAQASLAMAYSVTGADTPRPETSPVQSAIGLYDAPKVLAQEKHLLSGSYDTVLPYFVRWMQEIAEDMEIRQSDYQRFFGEVDALDARSAVRRVLGLDDRGRLRLLDLAPGGVHDPALAHDRLALLASDPNDLVGAVRAILDVGQQARLALISVLAHRENYRSQIGGARLAQVEDLLVRTVHWPYPVGATPQFDLAEEQAALDNLLRTVPDAPADLRDPTQGWARRLHDALHRACQVEQSLRDHETNYRAHYPDPRWRRGFRWYVWELHNLVRQVNGPEALGARFRETHP